MSSMTLDEYEKLPSEEKEHFAECLACGEIFDRRSLDKVLFHHTDHKDRPDIQYSGCGKAGLGSIRRSFQGDLSPLLTDQPLEK
jgi:hypothetical protein